MARPLERQIEVALLPARLQSQVLGPLEPQAAPLELATVHSALNLQVTQDFVHDGNSSTVMTMGK